MTRARRRAAPPEGGLRVLFLMRWGFLPQLVGGIQTALLDLCAGLARAGAEPALLCRELDAKPAFRWREPRWPILRAHEPAAALPAVAAALRPQLVMVVSSDVTPPLVEAALKLGLPTAILMMSTDISHLHMPLLADDGLMAFAADPFAAAQLRAAYDVPVEVLPLALDKRRWRPLAARRRRDSLLFVNPHPVKGFEIVRRIARARPDYRFVVCGSWPLEGEWRHWAESRLAGLANVEAMPARPDLRPLLARARALLVPSVVEEGSGRATLEAQAQGVPVIASRRGGLPLAVGAGGVCVDLHAPLDAWLAAVDRVMTDDRHHARLAAAALKRAAAPDRDLDRVVGRFLAAAGAHARRIRLAQLGGAP